MQQTKKQTKRQRNLQFFAAMPDVITEHYNGFIFYLFTGDHGLPCAAGMAPKCANPDFYFRFPTEERRADFLNSKRQTIDFNIQAERERLARYEVDRAKIQPGAVLCSTWGYEQTNVDFYIVLERKNDFVILQEIGATKSYTGDMSGNCVPDPETKTGEPFRKKVSKYGGVDLASYKYCSLWDGRPVGWSSYA